MSTSVRLRKMQCFVAVPRTESGMAAYEAITKAARQASFATLSNQFQNALIAADESSTSLIARCDCVVADVTGNSPDVLVEVGVALAMEKAIVLVGQDGSTPLSPQLSLLGPGLTSDYPVINFSMSDAGLQILTDKLNRTLREIRTLGRRPRQRQFGRLAPPFVVDWNRLDPRDAENLVKELLIQLGYRQIDWFVGSQFADIAAILPRKDPDGFEYRELWIVSFGLNKSSREFIDDPDYFLHRLMLEDRSSYDEIVSRSDTDPTITFLLVRFGRDRDNMDRDLMKRWEQRGHSRSSRDFRFRLRVWDQSYLTGLVQQYPQIGYKYFSEEARWQKYRKTPEELYQENADLTYRLTRTLGELEAEKNLRVRAERDAVWKDISFSAAHKIGNPIFAIETDLQSLEKRLARGSISQAQEVTPNMQAAIERAKAIVDQFKSLAKALQIKIGKALLRPILIETCHSLEMEGVSVQVDCPEDLCVLGDSEKLAEIFDELARNATRWLDQKHGADASTKTAMVTAAIATPRDVPSSLNPTHRYAMIHFRDNGTGVELEKKESIFDAFSTSYIHGTGLGLALVRRLVEAHDGIVSEVGIPGEGADFLIFLPAFVEVGDEAEASSSKSRSKRTDTRNKAPTVPS